MPLCTATGNAFNMLVMLTNQAKLQEAMLGLLWRRPAIAKREIDQHILAQKWFGLCRRMCWQVSWK